MDIDKKPIRSLENLFAESIIPIVNREPFFHAFDNYEQAIRYAHNALPEEEQLAVQKRIHELPIKGILKVEIDVKDIKKEAQENNLNTVEAHLQFFRKESEQRMKRFKEATAHP